MKAPNIRKALSFGLSVVYFTTQVVLASATETNLWSERRKNQHTQLASLPSLTTGMTPQQLLKQMPSVDASISSLPKWTQSNKKLSLNVPTSFRSLIDAIPLTYGTIQDVYAAPNTDIAPVVLIQDVHLNTEAQTNIATVLQELINQAQVGAVGVEGSFTTFDFAPYRKYPNKNLTKAIVDDMVRQNLLAAPSYVGITSQAEPPAFIGVDDAQHYEANVNALYDARDQKPTVLKTLAKAREELETKKARAFSKELKSFDDLRLTYHQGRVGLGEYLITLSRYNVDRDFAIEQFLEAYNMEQNLDLKRVETERKRVIEQLTQKLSDDEVATLLTNSVAYRMGKLSFGAYYQGLEQLCKTKDISLRQTPHFQNYIRYVLLSDGIKAEALFDAVEKMESDITDKLAITPEEKSLVTQSEWVLLAEKLIDFSLTPKEWRRYSSPRFFNGEAKRGINLVAFEAFYREADIRSEKITERLLLGHPEVAKATEGSQRSFVVKNTPQDDRPKVLVLGGFHSPHVAQMLREKNISYITVSPKLTKVDDSSGSAYLSVFQRDKTPLDRLFAGEKLFVYPTHVAVTNPATSNLTQGVLEAEHGTGRAERGDYRFLPASSVKKGTTGIQIHNTWVVKTTTLLQGVTIETLALAVALNSSKIILGPSFSDYSSIILITIGLIFSFVHHDLWRASTYKGGKITPDQFAARLSLRWVGGVFLTWLLTVPHGSLNGILLSGLIHLIANLLVEMGMRLNWPYFGSYLRAFSMGAGGPSKKLSDIETMDELFQWLTSQNASSWIEPIKKVQKGIEGLNTITRGKNTPLEGLRSKVESLLQVSIVNGLSPDDVRKKIFEITKNGGTTGVFNEIQGLRSRQRADTPDQLTPGDLLSKYNEGRIACIEVEGKIQFVWIQKTGQTGNSPIEILNKREAVHSLARYSDIAPVPIYLDPFTDVTQQKVLSFNAVADQLIKGDIWAVRDSQRRVIYIPAPGVDPQYLYYFVHKKSRLELDQPLQPQVGNDFLNTRSVLLRATPQYGSDGVTRSIPVELAREFYERGLIKAFNVNGEIQVVNISHKNLADLIWTKGLVADEINPVGVPLTLDDVEKKLKLDLIDTLEEIRTNPNSNNEENEKWLLRHVTQLNQEYQAFTPEELKKLVPRMATVFSDRVSIGFSEGELTATIDQGSGQTIEWTKPSRLFPNLVKDTHDLNKHLVIYFVYHRYCQQFRFQGSRQFSGSMLEQAKEKFQKEITEPYGIKLVGQNRPSVEIILATIILLKQLPKNVLESDLVKRRLSGGIDLAADRLSATRIGHYDDERFELGIQPTIFTKRQFVECFYHEFGHVLQEPHVDRPSDLIPHFQKNTRYKLPALGFSAEERHSYIGIHTERFAETFMHYLLHGDLFKAGFPGFTSDQPLWKKIYEYYRDSVAGQTEYLFDQRNYDAKRYETIMDMVAPYSSSGQRDTTKIKQAASTILERAQEILEDLLRRQALGIKLDRVQQYLDLINKELKQKQSNPGSSPGTVGLLWSPVLKFFSRFFTHPTAFRMTTALAAIGEGLAAYAVRYSSDGSDVAALLTFGAILVLHLAFGIFRYDNETGEWKLIYVLSPRAPPGSAISLVWAVAAASTSLLAFLPFDNSFISLGWAIFPHGIANHYLLSKKKSSIEQSRLVQTTGDVSKIDKTSNPASQERQKMDSEGIVDTELLPILEGQESAERTQNIDVNIPTISKGTIFINVRQVRWKSNAEHILVELEMYIREKNQTAKTGIQNRRVGRLDANFDLRTKEGLISDVKVDQKGKSSYKGLGKKLTETAVNSLLELGAQRLLIEQVSAYDAGRSISVAMIKIAQGLGFVPMLDVASVLRESGNTPIYEAPSPPANQPYLRLPLTRSYPEIAFGTDKEFNRFISVVFTDLHGNVMTDPNEYKNKNLVDVIAKIKKGEALIGNIDYVREEKTPVPNVAKPFVIPDDVLRQIKPAASLTPQDKANLEAFFNIYLKFILWMYNGKSPISKAELVEAAEKIDSGLSVQIGLLFDGLTRDGTRDEREIIALSNPVKSFLVTKGYYFDSDFIMIRTNRVFISAIYEISKTKIYEKNGVMRVALRSRRWDSLNFNSGRGGQNRHDGVVLIVEDMAPAYAINRLLPLLKGRMDLIWPSAISTDLNATTSSFLRKDLSRILSEDEARELEELANLIVSRIKLIKKLNALARGKNFEVDWKNLSLTMSDATIQAIVLASAQFQQPDLGFQITRNSFEIKAKLPRYQLLINKLTEAVNHSNEIHEIIHSYDDDPQKREPRAHSNQLELSSIPGIELSHLVGFLFETPRDDYGEAAITILEGLAGKKIFDNGVLKLGVVIELLKELQTLAPDEIRAKQKMAHKNNFGPLIISESDLQTAQSVGGVIKSLRWLVLKIVPSLAPIYNTRVAPLIENALVFASQGILISNGLDAMTAGLWSWGLFVAIHFGEWVAEKIRWSRLDENGKLSRAPPSLVNTVYSALIAGITSALNTAFPFNSIFSLQSLPTLFGSIAIHGYMNGFSNQVALKKLVYSRIRKERETYVNRLPKFDFEEAFKRILSPYTQKGYDILLTTPFTIDDLRKIANESPVEVGLFRLRETHQWVMRKGDAESVRDPWDVVGPNGTAIHDISIHTHPGDRNTVPSPSDVSVQFFAVGVTAWVLGVDGAVLFDVNNLKHSEDPEKNLKFPLSEISSRMPEVPQKDPQTGRYTDSAKAEYRKVLEKLNVRVTKTIPWNKLRLKDLPRNSRGFEEVLNNRSRKVRYFALQLLLGLLDRDEATPFLSRFVFDPSPRIQNLINGKLKLKTKGGIIKSLRWVILKLIPSLAPIYNTRVAPLLENALVFAGQYFLMANGLDAMAAGLWSWGIFAAIHIVEWLINRDSGRNVTYSVLIAGVSILVLSFLSTDLTSLQFLLYAAISTTFHLGTNKFADNRSMMTSVQWLSRIVTALAKQDNAAAINASSIEQALDVEGIAGQQISANGAVSLDQMKRWTQDPAFLNAFIATLPQDFKMEGKEAVLIATVLKAAGFDDSVVIALTKLQTKKYHVIAFHENMSQDELAAGLALAKLTNQTARVTMNANAQAQFNEMKGKLTFALPQLEMMIDPTNTLFMPSADGLTFDAVAFQKLSKLSLEDVALLHSKGLLINAGGLTPPLSILLNDLVPIVRDTNLGQIDRVLRAILAAA